MASRADGCQLISRPRCFDVGAVRLSFKVKVALFFTTAFNSIAVADGKPFDNVPLARKIESLSKLFANCRVKEYLHRNSKITA